MVGERHIEGERKGGAAGGHKGKVPNDPGGGEVWSKPENQPNRSRQLPGSQVLKPSVWRDV